MLLCLNVTICIIWNLNECVSFHLSSIYIEYFRQIDQQSFYGFQLPLVSSFTCHLSRITSNLVDVCLISRKAVSYLFTFSSTVYSCSRIQSCIREESLILRTTLQTTSNASLLSALHIAWANFSCYSLWLGVRILHVCSNYSVTAYRTVQLYLMQMQMSPKIIRHPCSN